MQKILFLDRDGVINIEKDYLYKVEDFEFIEGIFDLCTYFQNHDYRIVVVTNQSGIARGYYTEDDFLILSDWMRKIFSSKGIDIYKINFCPHHPSITGKCNCRKPNPGMLYDLGNEFEVDYKNSVMVGDKERDIEAGINAGLETTYLFSEDGSILKSKAKRIVNHLDQIWK